MLDKNIQKQIEEIIKQPIDLSNPLYGGMMNESYLINNHQNSYILYLPTAQANEMVDRHLEKYNIDLIFPLGITSKNIFFDEQSGIKINEYIKGESLNNLNEFSYDEVARLFHKLHDAKLHSLKEYEPFKRFLSFKKEANEYVTFESDFCDLENVLFANKEFLEKQERVLSHNDSQRSNVVKAEDGKYYLIDFEFMMDNDPLYDIAAFGNNKVEEGYELLKVYFNNHQTKEEEKRFFLWRIFLSLQWYMVALIKHYRGEGKTHHIDFNGVANFFLENANHAYQLMNK